MLAWYAILAAMILTIASWPSTDVAVIERHLTISGVLTWILVHRGPAEPPLNIISRSRKTQKSLLIRNLALLCRQIPLITGKTSTWRLVTGISRLGLIVAGLSMPLDSETLARTSATVSIVAIPQMRPLYRDIDHRCCVMLGLNTARPDRVLRTSVRLLPLRACAYSP